MSTPTPPADFPPVNKGASSDKASAGEQRFNDASPAAAQESALTSLRRTWLRCGPTDRALFLVDVRAGCPNLWRVAERDGGGRGR